MASEKLPLTIIRSPTAIDDLHGIWRWNALRYNVAHADEYLHYLDDKIEALASGHFRGRSLRTHPDIKYALVRRRARGHGHVVVYRLSEHEIHILHIFHTAQDW